MQDHPHNTAHGMADTHFLFLGDFKDVHAEEMDPPKVLHARGWKTIAWKLQCVCPTMLPMG